MKRVMFLILGVSVEKSVPPGERRSIVAHKIHVVEVMETSSSVEWNQMQGVQRNVVTTRERTKEEKYYKNILVGHSVNLIFSLILYNVDNYCYSQTCELEIWCYVF